MPTGPEEHRLEMRSHPRPKRLAGDYQDEITSKRSQARSTHLLGGGSFLTDSYDFIDTITGER
jgi:hypothetical protein